MAGIPYQMRQKPHTVLSQRSIISIGGAEQVFNEGNKSNMLSSFDFF